MTHCMCRWMPVLAIIVAAVIANTGAVGADQVVYNFDPDNGDLSKGYNGNSPWGLPMTDLPVYNGYHLPVREGYVSYENQYDFVDDSVNPENQDPTDGNGYYVNTQSPDKGHWFWDGRWDGDPSGWLPGASDHVSPNNNLPSGNGAKVYIRAPWSGKAVVAVIGENGPAPWTGRQFGASNKVFEALGLPTAYKQFSKGNPNPGHAPGSSANPADYPVIRYDDNPYWVEFSWADQSLQPGPVNPAGDDPPMTNSIAWEFNTPANSEGWLAYNAGILNEATNVQSDGLFIIDPIGPDPWIENRLCSIDASSVDSIKIRMSSNCEDDTGAIYFSTAESPGFDEDKKVGFIVSHGSEWHEYDIPISNSNWKGTITGLRIDPADFGSESSESHDDTFGFDYIRLLGVPTETDTPSDQDTPPSTVVTPDSPTTPPAPVQSSTPVVAETPNSYMNVPFYSQKDSSWSGEKLGRCSTKIGDEGCAITSVAMVFKYYGIQTNPLDMNNWLKQNNGYSDGCNINWITATKRTGGAVKWIRTSGINLDMIKTELNNRHPVIAKVSLSNTGHYIVITGYTGSDFIINDPLKGITTFKKNYGDPATGIKGIRLYYGLTPISGDLYGTGRDITGIFDPSTSEFNFNGKTVQFGTRTDTPVIGDWDCDGKDEIGVFRPSDDDGRSKFYLVTRNWTDLGDKAGGADMCIDFGPYPTNIPITGDWNGDGHDDIGGFNPENNVFYLYKLDLEAKPPSAKSYKDVPFGKTGDIPFIGDWDRDGKDELGVFRSPYPVENPGTNAFYCDRKLTGDQHELGDLGTDGKLKPYTYGDIGDYPVIGDWDGDGDDDIGVYRPHNKKFCKDSTIPVDPGMGADIVAIIHAYGSHEGDDDYNPVHDVNSDGVIDLSDFVGALKDTIMGVLNSISL